jgi:hypothetical protein
MTHGSISSAIEAPMVTSGTMIASSQWSIISPSLLVCCVRRACMPSRQSPIIESSMPTLAASRASER